jgi:pimeloyl-ACP methyl ester carboxylesterase
MKYPLLWLLAFVTAQLGCGPAGEEPLEAEQIADEAQAIVGNCSDHDLVFTLEHSIPVSTGATLHVVEKFSLASVLRPQRRAILMLPATLVTNVIWNAEVPSAPDDFNALDRAAREGFFAFTLDWEGYGESSHPPDGFDVTAERLLAASAALVKWIRLHRFVKKVDLMGSSLGSSLAVALGGKNSPMDHHRIGHVVLTAHVYKNATPFANETLFSPESMAFLLSAPNGYVATAPAVYAIITAFSEPEVFTYCELNCPGTYAVGPTLEGFDLPVFAASKGRAPLLQFWGDNDLITPLSDAQQFQSEYGGPAELVVLPGGGHVPHWEAVRETFWEQTFDFLADGD